METIEQQTELSLEDMREMLEQVKISMEEAKSKIVREIEEDTQEKIKQQVETALEHAKNEAMFEIKSLKPILSNIEDKKDFLCGELRKYCDFKDTTIGYAYINSGCPEMSNDEWIKTLTDFYNGSNGELHIWDESNVYGEAKQFLFKIFMIRFLKIGIDKYKVSGNQEIHFPEEVDTQGAKALVGKIKYCVKDGDFYKWGGTSALFGYFVDIVSKKLDVRGCNDRIPWKIFKAAFQCEENVITTAKQAVNDYKNKCISKPEGYLDIKRACK